MRKPIELMTEDEREDSCFRVMTQLREADAAAERVSRILGHIVAVLVVIGSLLYFALRII